jgi:glutamate formiminotransferase / formiminotetrahydrofolate cyclodeaminase
MKPLIECVPNFSEGRDINIINQITNAIENVEGIKLLNVDPGKATNRTVVTFVGHPDAVIEAAFRGIKKASELIDMSRHKGEHPRMGATDVCPLIPLNGITMEETVEYAKKLGERVGRELDIPVYLYEYAASKNERKNLAAIRAGEYEGIAEKIKLPEWKPDYGKPVFNVSSGNTAIGARDFMVAYNVNLNTTSVKRANSVAFDVRENGRVKKDLNGKTISDANGNAERIPGTCKAVKAIGWYIEEYGIAQISMNLTNINITPVHIAFDEVCKSADKRGLRVTGSELVGLIPLKCLLEAGKYFLHRQQRSSGVSESELIKIAVKSFGLDELAKFEPRKRIIEYLLEDELGLKLIDLTLKRFADETASESPAPGGGSVAAYLGALGASLATMVANLSAGKKGWEQQWKTFSDDAEKGQQLKDSMLKLVDEDTLAFNEIMKAFQLSKSNEEEIKIRKAAIERATELAIETPLKVMQLGFESMSLIWKMAESGNPNSVSDAGVGALCARSAVYGAYLNVRINAKSLQNEKKAKQYVEKAEKILSETLNAEKEILRITESKL